MVTGVDISVQRDSMKGVMLVRRDIRDHCVDDVSLLPALRKQSFVLVEHTAEIGYSDAGLPWRKLSHG